MPITVPITPKRYRQLKRAIRKGIEVVCLDQQSYLQCLLIGQELAARGENVDPKKIILQLPEKPESPKGK